MSRTGKDITPKCRNVTCPTICRDPPYKFDGVLTPTCMQTAVYCRIAGLLQSGSLVFCEGCWLDVPPSTRAVVSLNSRSYAV